MLFIRFGSYIELRGILLCLSGNTIRVALEECGDSAEFRRTSEGWIAENGEVVEIEWRSAPEGSPFRVPLTSTAFSADRIHGIV